MKEAVAHEAPRRPPAAWKALLLVIVVAALLIGGLWAWRVSQSGAPAWSAAPVDVRSLTLQAQDAPQALEALGELRAVNQVRLAAEVAGRVAAIHFEPGQRVVAGALLVQLDDSVERADLAAARADARFAEQQYRRAVQLADSGAMSKEILQERQAQHESAQARIQQLQARIRKLRIEAPFAGELGLRHVDLGQYLNPGDEIVSLTDLQQLYVDFDLPQQALPQVRLGQPARIDVGTPGLAPVQGQLIAIEPQVGRDTRNASLRAQVANADGQLRPGMYASVALQLPAQPQALLLPSTAIMASPFGDAVVRVQDISAERIGRAEIVPVQLGQRLGDQVIVARGLQPGDVVVTEGQLRVRPDAQVQLVDARSTAP